MYMSFTDNMVIYRHLWKKRKFNLLPKPCLSVPSFPVIYTANRWEFILSSWGKILPSGFSYQSSPHPTLPWLLCLSPVPKAPWASSPHHNQPWLLDVPLGLFKDGLCWNVVGALLTWSWSFSPSSKEVQHPFKSQSSAGLGNAKGGSKLVNFSIWCKPMF